MMFAMTSMATGCPATARSASRAPAHAGPAARHAPRPQRVGRPGAPGASKSLRFARTPMAASVDNAQAGVGKLISKVEIPAFIPRQDMMNQLFRWASDLEDNGYALIGSPCKITPLMEDEQVRNFTISLLNSGVSVADILIAFDEDVAVKHEWIGMGPDKFPVPEGKATDVHGKHLEVRKTDTNSVSDALRAALHLLCANLAEAVNKYYAFGSCFSEDAT
ncbi:hypothetical protein ACKKBG_A10310 [Auxenochlorella protothecoides x Auxenochlorella symbiontica]